MRRGRIRVRPSPTRNERLTLHKERGIKLRRIDPTARVGVALLAKLFGPLQGLLRDPPPAQFIQALAADAQRRRRPRFQPLQLGARASAFLFGITPSESGKNPLAQFQCTSYEKNAVRKLLHSLNETNPTARLPSDRLDRTFEICWGGLQEKLDPLATSKDHNTLTAAKAQIAPQPNMRLEDVVKQITGTQMLPGSNEIGSDKILRTCETLRESSLRTYQCLRAGSAGGQPNRLNTIEWCEHLRNRELIRAYQGIYREEQGFFLPSVYG